MNLNGCLLSLLAGLYLSACTTRSISNSEYGGNLHYHGELTELEVLGIDPDREISEESISEAFQQRTRIKLNRGDSIVLVQSGKRFPDETMITAAEAYFKVIPLSGVPRQNRQHHKVKTNSTLDKPFRLAAARGGADLIIVYWGILETARKGHATKMVSWVPLAGKIIPDEKQSTRIRLKAIIMDVSSGNWEMLTPAVYSDEKTTAKINRRQKDQQQIDRLKTKAYQRLIEDIQTRFDEP